MSRLIAAAIRFGAKSIAIFSRGQQLPRDDHDREAWRGLFAAYDTIILVANSEEGKDADLAGFRSRNALFVFFNDARRVVAGPFEGDSVLVLRSGREGPSVVRRGRLSSVRECFGQGRLKLVLNLCADASEKPMDLRSDETDTRILDLTGYFADRYTAGKIPSSGYAMAVWLLEQARARRIVLAGFSALRSEQWRVFDIHDWTLEQTALRFLQRSGALEIVGTRRAGPDRRSALAAQFPGVDPVEILATETEVLAERLDHSDLYIDRLWGATRLPRMIQRWLRRLHQRRHR